MPGEIVVQKIKYYRSEYDIWIKFHIKDCLLIDEEVADEVVITSPHSVQNLLENFDSGGNVDCPYTQ